MERYWTEAEQKRLLGVLELVPANDLPARRDAAAIKVLIHSGLRVGEFLALTLGDTLRALRTGYLYLPKAYRKGKRRDHHVRVTEALRKDLQALLAVRAEMLPGDAHERDALVVSRLRDGMTVRNFQLRVKAWALRAGLPPESSPHWARHTLAMNVINRSSARNPLGIVQSLLGHASLSSTGIYTGPSREEVDTALEETTRLDLRQRVTRAQLRRAYEGATS